MFTILNAVAILVAATAATVYMMPSHDSLVSNKDAIVIAAVDKEFCNRDKTISQISA
jgi:hypothetical protein